MIYQKIVITLITLSLAACSSYKKPATLDGKKREPINKFRYTKPPLVVIDNIQSQPFNSKIQNTESSIKRTTNRQVTPVKSVDILDAEERVKNKEKV